LYHHSLLHIFKPIRPLSLLCADDFTDFLCFLAVTALGEFGFFAILADCNVHKKIFVFLATLRNLFTFVGQRQLFVAAQQNLVFISCILLCTTKNKLKKEK